MSTWEKKRPQRSKRTNALSKNLAFFVAFFIACFAILTPSNDDFTSVLDDGFRGVIIEPLSSLSLEVVVNWKLVRNASFEKVHKTRAATRG